MTTDKTGAPTTVTAEPDRFTIAVDDRPVGRLEFRDAAGKRVFTHTGVDEAFQGRGLATILVGAALQATVERGLCIVPECPMVADYLRHHPEFNAVVDPAS